MGRSGVPKDDGKWLAGAVHQFSRNTVLELASNRATRGRLRSFHEVAFESRIRGYLDSTVSHYLSTQPDEPEYYAAVLQAYTEEFARLLPSSGLARALGRLLGRYQNPQIGSSQGAVAPPVPPQEFAQEMARAHFGGDEATAAEVLLHELSRDCRQLKCWIGGLPFNTSVEKLGEPPLAAQAGSGLRPRTEDQQPLHQAGKRVWTAGDLEALFTIVGDYVDDVLATGEAPVKPLSALRRPKHEIKAAMIRLHGILATPDGRRLVFRSFNKDFAAVVTSDVYREQLRLSLSGLASFVPEKDAALCQLDWVITQEYVATKDIDLWSRISSEQRARIMSIRENIGREGRAFLTELDRQ